MKLNENFLVLNMIRLLYIGYSLLSRFNFVASNHGGANTKKSVQLMIPASNQPNLMVVAQPRDSQPDALLIIVRVRFLILPNYSVTEVDQQRRRGEEGEGAVLSQGIKK